MHLLNELTLNAQETKSLWVLGDLYTFRLTGEQTDGRLAVIEAVIQPNSAPPPHIHHNEDESFYVLEGTFSFLYGDQTISGNTGSFVHVPKGTPHTFQNIGTTPGRLLTIISPAGLEQFFMEIGTSAEEGAPEFDPAIIEKIMKLAPVYHMEVLPPPTL